MVDDSDIPDFVYKAFPREEYALAFVNEGIFRIGSLNQYKQTEDENRKDATEGQSSYQYETELQQIHYSAAGEVVGTSTKKGLMNVGGIWGNPTYLFCTSLPCADPAFLRERFGNHLVQINDPRQLIHDMENALRKSDYNLLGNGRVFGRAVDYSKGQVLEIDVESATDCELSYTQKSAEYSDEREFRFIAMMEAFPDEDPPEHIELNLGKQVDYASMC